MSAYGMDLERARKLARVAQHHSDDVTALAGQVQKRIDDLDWFGPDAQKFRAEQLPRLSERLKQVSASAGALALDAERNVRDQQQASGG